MDQFKRLGREAYDRPALQAARALLGTKLVRVLDGVRLAGYIVETEAYGHEEDLGCHCRHGRTPRTQVMYGPPGHAYVYFTYGMHWMLNFVVEPPGLPAAVLIRALMPVEGIEQMAALRAKSARAPARFRYAGAGVPVGLADGPGKLCQALAITGRLNGADLCSPQAELYVETGAPVPDSAVTIGPRVGLNTVPEPWKSVPWRFRVIKSDFRGGQA